MKVFYRTIVKLFVAISVVLSLGYSTTYADNGTYTLSGTITSSDGTPLSNFGVAAQRIGSSGLSPLGCTDADGHYSIMAEPGLYRLNLQGYKSGLSGSCESAYAPQPGSQAPSDGALISGSSHLYQEVSITDSDIVRNFQLPTVKLTITALNINGNPIVDSNAYADYSTVYESSLINGGSSTIATGTSFLFPQKTNSDGQVSGYILKGGVFLPGTICVNAYPQPTICNTSAMTIQEDTNVTLQPTLVPPLNLTATSPTKAPNLTWNAVAGATSYNIYANGILVGTSTTNSYTDNNPTSGNSTYYVTAVNNNGESGHSNSITVTVDITAPVVTNVSQFWNAVKQRTEITLTFSEAVTGLPQGWYGSGTTYTKAFYNTKLAHVTFVDAVGNIGTTTVTPIGPQ